MTFVQDLDTNIKFIEKNFRFEVLTAMTTKNMIFWIVLLCSSAQIHWHFDGMSHPHLHDQRVSEARNLQIACCLLPQDLFFNPEDGCSTFL
jgi:hypothetical protein